jgi:hypothetical protein
MSQQFSTINLKHNWSLKWNTWYDNFLPIHNTKFTPFYESPMCFWIDLFNWNTNQMIQSTLQVLQKFKNLKKI